MDWKTRKKNLKSGSVETFSHQRKHFTQTDPYIENGPSENICRKECCLEGNQGAYNARAFLSPDI
jgi:hypothetical protein